MDARGNGQSLAVSTHSRLKAAGHAVIINQFQFNSFNTQPPEGGWAVYLKIKDSA